MHQELHHFDRLLELYSTIAEDAAIILVENTHDSSSVLGEFRPPNFSENIFSTISGEISEKSFIQDFASSNPHDILYSINRQDTKIDIHLICATEHSRYYLLELEASAKNDAVNHQLDLIRKSISERIEFNEKINIQYVETTSNINTVIYSTNATGSKYHFVSASVEKLFNLEVDRIIDNKISLLRKIVPEYFKGYSNFIKSLKSGKKAVYEYQIFGKDQKTKRWVRHTGNPVLINDKVERVVGIIDDITEEKTILNKLGKSEEKFRLLIETANDLIISLNSFGYISMVNKNGAKSLGYRPDEILGKHFLELIEEKNKSDTIDAFQKILSSADLTKFEATLVDKFENPVIFDFQATPTKDEGVISGMLAIGRDVTKRRHDENRMRELNTRLMEANRLVSIERDRAKQQLTVLEELNKLKNDFVSRISHELRTPLASIVGFAETIVSDEDLPKELVQEFSNIILTEGKRLAKLVDDILDFSKLENSNSVNKEPVDIIELLRSLSERFKKIAEEKKIVLGFELPEAEIIIFADREMISKAIEELIENAIRFNNPEGRVSVITQSFLNEVEIIISDTGVGISQGRISKLFDKFSNIDTKTFQSSGAGLGLAYVKQVIDIHRGLLQVKSELNKGSSFIIRLPKKNKGN